MRASLRVEDPNQRLLLERTPGGIHCEFHREERGSPTGGKGGALAPILEPELSKEDRRCREGSLDLKAQTEFRLFPAL